MSTDAKGGTKHADEGNRLEAARLREPLRSLPLRKPARVPLDAPLGEALRRMREANAGSCLVEHRDGRLAGIVTERDVVNKLPLTGANVQTMPVEEFMHPNPETLKPDHPIAYALNRMAGGGYRNIPLVDDDGRAVGLVTQRDVVEDLCSWFSDEVLCIPPTRSSAIAKKREGA